MAHKPMSRDAMLSLKSDEEDRLDLINNIVKEVYINAVHTAKTTSETSFHYSLYLGDMYIHMYTPSFYTRNMSEIVSKVQDLFPDCSVTHTVIEEGVRESIIVDWS